MGATFAVGKINPDGSDELVEITDLSSVREVNTLWISTFLLSAFLRKVHSLEKIAKKRDALINPGSPQYGSAIKLINKGREKQSKKGLQHQPY